MRTGGGFRVERAKVRGEGREIERRAIYKGGKKRERANVHTSRLWDGTAPGRGIYLRNCPCQMGRDKQDRQARKGEGTIVGTLKGGNLICRLVRGQGNPGSLYHPPPGPLLTESDPSLIPNLLPCTCTA